MEIIKSGKYKDCSKFYYDVGFDLGDDFNCASFCCDEKFIKEAVEKTMKEFAVPASEVDVRKIRTTTRKIIFQKSGDNFVTEAKAIRLQNKI